MSAELCHCGHTAEVHGVTEPGCAGRCLCELCPEGTENDCWCVGFLAAAVGGGNPKPKEEQ